MLMEDDNSELIIKEKTLRGSLGRIKGNRIAIRKVQRPMSYMYLRYSKAGGINF